MKLLTFAGLATGLFLLMLASKKVSPQPSTKPPSDEPNSRYDVDDFISDQEL